LFASASVAALWSYNVYSTQLNNSIAVQRCALEIERARKLRGALPEEQECVDSWGARISYYRRGETYVLVSGGRHHHEELAYNQLTVSSLPERSTCFGRDMDTVFAGRRALQACLK
jgi:hypothetical protein